MKQLKITQNHENNQTMGPSGHFWYLLHLWPLWHFWSVLVWSGLMVYYHSGGTPGAPCGAKVKIRRRKLAQ